MQRQKGEPCAVSCSPTGEEHTSTLECSKGQRVCVEISRPLSSWVAQSKRAGFVCLLFRTGKLHSARSSNWTVNCSYYSLIPKRFPLFRVTPSTFIMHLDTSSFNMCYVYMFTYIHNLYLLIHTDIQLCGVLNTTL